MKVIITENQWNNISDNLLPKEDFEKFLSADNFSDEILNDPEKEFFIQKLENLKNGFRDFLRQPTPQGFTIQYVLSVIQHAKILINKMRLIIDPKFTIAYQYDEHKKIKYTTIRAYWIDNNNKKFRKFAVNIKSKRIGEKTKQEISKKLTNMMWNQFKDELMNRIL